MPLLDALDVRPRVERAGFLRPARALLHWPPLHGYEWFGPAAGFQVDRAQFDRLLLEAAQDAGAQVFTAAKLGAVQRSPRGGWDVTFCCDGRGFGIERCFLVDATGRQPALAGSAWSARKHRYAPETLALSGYWTGWPASSVETRVEAGEAEWFWGAPLPDGRFNATVFVDAARCRNEARSRDGRERLYLGLLQRSELLAPCRRGHCGAFAAYDATCRIDAQPVAPELIRIGEASFSIDPLSSQGVQAAIGSGLHAAAVIHTILTRPADREIAERFYRERQQEAVSFHRTAAADLYDRVAVERDAAFWRDRALSASHSRETMAVPRQRPPSSTRLQLDARTVIASTPCLEGDIIRNALAVTHPGLTRPTAFLGDVPLPPLLDCLRSPLDRDAVLRSWSPHAPVDTARGILDWLWTRGVIVEAKDASSR
jgi:flavin-dependent dehydrogenase